MNRFLLILLLCCLSCSQSENKTEATAHTPESRTEPATGPAIPAPEDLTPEVIANMPEAKTGCTGLFTYDSVALKKNNFVFVQKRSEGKAVLQIDGKPIELDLVEKTEPAGGQSREIYSAGQHKVILTSSRTRPAAGEAGDYSGTLEIYKDVSERKLKVHGRVTCK